MSDSHFEILANEMAPLGALCLRRRELLLRARHNRARGDTEPRVLDEQPVHRFGACLGANGDANACWRRSKVLVGGLGLGGGAAVGMRFRASYGTSGVGDHTGRCILTAQRARR